MVSTELAQRKAELEDYTIRINKILIDPKLKPELERANSYSIYSAIGSLACHQCIIGEEDRALELADDLLALTKSDEYVAKNVYRELVTVGSKKAIDIYRDLMEKNKEKIGDQDSEYSVYWYCDDLIDLYKAGDQEAGAMARELIGLASDDELEAYGNRAIRLFQAGDETAFQLILDTTDGAIAYHHDKESEVSELDRLLAATSRATGGQRIAEPGTEVITYLARNLKSLAIDLIKKGDLERAEEIQSRLPKEVDRVHIDAVKIAEGLDVDGRYQQNVDMLAKSNTVIYNPIFDTQACFDILRSSALGGNMTALKEFEAIVQEELEEEDVTSDGLAAAQVLLQAGKMSEVDFRKVLDATSSTSDRCDALVELGRTEEAIQLVRDEFANNPSSVTAAYDLLRYEYNQRAMDLVQNHTDEYDRNVVDIMSRRAGWLGKLAKHIRQLQNTES